MVPAISRLRDMLHEYFHERVRQDQANLSREQTESQRLFPAPEDMETIKQHLAIIKVNGNWFTS